MKQIIIWLMLCLSAAACSDNDEPVMPQPVQKGTFTDERDGTEYHWVRFDTLDWMVENLRYEPLNGTFAPDLTPVSPGYYDDGKNTAYYETYGGLYDSEAAQEAVPEGWRLPTDADWQCLEQALGMTACEAAATGKRGGVQGEWLRDAGGMNLQLGGYKIPDERNMEVGTYTSIYGLYWSATTDETKPNESFAWCRKLQYNSSQVERESVSKNYQLSVRCVRRAIP
ncbi:MAG: fibrobacter succinogenes major paralogous domain-containing protein [Odoribacter sp.]|nr:fibrobacter succinogenes major paralogous domain-containing protein [Odoribacter sp.]